MQNSSNVLIFQGDTKLNFGTSRDFPPRSSPGYGPVFKGKSYLRGANPRIYGSCTQNLLFTSREDF